MELDDKKRKKSPVNDGESNLDQSTSSDYLQLDIQEKWNIISLVWREYNPEKGSYPSDLFQKVAQKVHRSEDTVRRVQQEYADQCQNEPNKRCLILLQNRMVIESQALKVIKASLSRIFKVQVVIIIMVKRQRN
jgi:hypothetical protein